MDPQQVKKFVLAAIDYEIGLKDYKLVNVTNAIERDLVDYLSVTCKFEEVSGKNNRWYRFEEFTISKRLFTVGIKTIISRYEYAEEKCLLWGDKYRNNGYGWIPYDHGCLTARDLFYSVVRYIAGRHQRIAVEKILNANHTLEKYSQSHEIAPDIDDDIPY